MSIIRTALAFNEPKYKAGFRKDYLTTDHIRTVSQVIEKCAEYNQPLHIVFIDCEKAFDSVETSAVTQALRNQDVETAHVKILEEIYSACTAAIVSIKKAVKFL